MGFWGYESQQDKSMEATHTHTLDMDGCLSLGLWWVSLSVHLVRTGGREAHKLAVTKSCSICIVRVSKSGRSGTIPHRQYDSNSLHKETRGHLLPSPMQGKPSAMARSHRQEYHNSPPSVVSLEGQRRGELPQQTQSVEMGLQVDLIGVSEGLLQTTGVAHF